jgi:hypothetical protein
MTTRKGVKSGKKKAAKKAKVAIKDLKPNKRTQGRRLSTRETTSQSRRFTGCGAPVLQIMSSLGGS